MNKNVLKKVCKKLTVILMVAMLLVTSIPSAFAAAGQASTKAGSVTITSETQLEPYFPDAAFRAAVFAAVSNGQDNAVGTDIKDALRNFTGDIDAAKKGIMDITGLDLLRQAEEIDLRKNQITDFSQLGRNKGTEEEFKTWFGVADGTGRTEGENVHLRIGGNPIEKIPTDFGGKIVIEQPGSTAYTYDESASSHFTYLRPTSGNALSGTINIGKAKVVDHGNETPVKVISAAWNSHGKPDASKFKVDSFTNTTAKFSGLRKSGTGYIAVGVDEEIHYQTADEYGTITPGSQSFKYYLSPTFTETSS